MTISFGKRGCHWDFSNCDGRRGILLNLWLVGEVVLVVTLDIGHSPGLFNRSHSKFLGLALSTKTPEDEEGTAESSDEDNRDGNSGYSSCTNTVGAIVGGLDDGSVA